jgi:hypothetical protein
MIICIIIFFSNNYIRKISLLIFFSNFQQTLQWIKILYKSIIITIIIFVPY